MDRKGQRDPSTHLKEPHFEEIETPLSLVFGHQRKRDCGNILSLRNNLSEHLLRLILIPSLNFPSFTPYL